MNHTADSLESLVEKNVRRQVGGGPEVAFEHLAIQASQHQVLRLHLLVGNTTRLNHDQAFFPQNSTRVSEGVKYQAAANQFEIGFEHLLTKLLQRFAGTDRWGH